MNGDAQLASRSKVSRPLRWLERMLIGLVILFFILTGLGMLYQVIGEINDRRSYLPPGQLVDVGGHRLHIFCLGEGGPTVILDAMADGMSVNWIRVQTRVAAVTRVCAYDRAGLGWSDPADPPRDAFQAAEELQALLTNSALDGPYILVGHSYGSHVVRVFASRYPAGVAGVVLVDPGILYRDPRFPPVYRAEAESADRFLAIAPWLARVGLFRLIGRGSILAQDLPQQQREAYNAAYNSVRFWQALHLQHLGWQDTTLQVQTTDDLGDRPLLVLSANQPDEGIRQVWTKVNAGLALLSTRGVHRVISGATHAGIVQSDPYAAETSAAIIQVVRAARR